ncbi:MAG: hypothetical protein PVH89_04090 [Gammaproteobacteria bacterium]|jgi:hypothetical protein
MKKIDLGQMISILANVGVIAGIVFLGIELRQNNDFLAAQARLGQLDATVARIQIGLNNPDLADINWRERNGEPLTPAEQNRYFEYALFTMMHWRWEYQEYQAGALPEVDLAAWRVQASFSPIWRRAWDGTLGSQDTEFAHFVNENVFTD